MPKLLKCAQCREISSNHELRKLYLDNVSCPICFNDIEIKLYATLCGHVCCNGCIEQMMIEDPNFSKIFNIDNIIVKWEWNEEYKQWILNMKEDNNGKIYPENSWYRKNTNTIPFIPIGYKAIWFKAKKASLRRWILIER